MAAEFLGVGWHFPVSLESTGEVETFAVARYEQSIRESIRIILETAKGERVMRPDFGCGIHDLVFAVNDSTTHAQVKHEVRDALDADEPRIEVLEVDVTDTGADGEQVLISIDYRVRATNGRANMVYPFYLIRGGT